MTYSSNKHGMLCWKPWYLLKIGCTAVCLLALILVEDICIINNTILYIPFLSRCNVTLYLTTCDVTKAADWATAEDRGIGWVQKTTGEVITQWIITCVLLFHTFVLLASSTDWSQKMKGRIVGT